MPCKNYHRAGHFLRERRPFFALAKQVVAAPRPNRTSVQHYLHRKRRTKPKEASMKRISSPRSGFERRQRQRESRDEVSRQLRLIILHHFRAALTGEDDDSHI